MTANLAALMPAPSKAASISCRWPSGVRTRPRLSCLRISPAANNDAVDVIASRLRHLHYLRQVGLHATLTDHRREEQPHLGLTIYFQGLVQFFKKSKYFKKNLIMKPWDK